MKVNKATSVEEYKLISSFQSLRATLLEDRYADRMARPLAYWALPTDRRLPLAFLGRPLGELLDTPFDELSSTPGIGQKKISSLIKLLSRATKDHPPSVPFDGVDGPSEEDQRPARTTAEKALATGGFDPALVSEALWSQWRECVQRHALGGERLGRLAPTLQNLPTVIWHTTLDHYTDVTVAQMRSMKTHGEKRVRVILEVFYHVNAALTGAKPQDHLMVQLRPRFIAPIDRWITDQMRQQQIPSHEELVQKLVAPILEQLQHDTGATIAKLAEGRLGIGSAPQSVRQQARRMGVTRARVYQLLDECAKVMEVRWPEGRCLLANLDEHYRSFSTAKDDLSLFRATASLLFPRGDDGQIEEVGALAHARRELDEDGDLDA